MIEVILAAQLNCLAEAVFAEARGEPYGGQVLVAGVIKNRVLDSRWSDDFCSVIAEPWQFSYVHEVSDRQLQAMIEAEPDAWERAVRAAYSVFHSGEEPLFENLLYYHATRIRPGWDYSKIDRAKTVGRHVFYRDAS